MKDLLDVTREEIDDATIMTVASHVGAPHRSDKLAKRFSESAEFMDWVELLVVASDFPMSKIATFVTIGIEIGYQLAIAQIDNDRERPH